MTEEATNSDRCREVWVEARAKKSEAIQRRLSADIRRHLPIRQTATFSGQVGRA